MRTRTHIVKFGMERQEAIKRFALAPLALVLLVGCRPATQITAQSPTPAESQSHLSHPARSRVGNPYVLIIGDELVTAWGANTTNQPMWTFAGSPAGSMELSDSVAARLPALLAAKHYDVVVIEAGTFDIARYPLGELCNIDNPASSLCPLGPLGNLSRMVHLAHAAGSDALICELPYTDPRAAIYNDTLSTNENEFNETLTVSPSDYNYDDLVMLNAVSISTPWTTDGLVPNATGAQAFTGETQVVLSTLQDKWGNR